MVFRSAIRHVVRHTAAGWCLNRACVRWHRDTAVEELPGWLGALTGVKLPRRTRAGLQPDTRTGPDIDIIFELLEATDAVPGDIAECGVFQGDTLVPIALYARQHAFSKMVFGFDSFAGFDDSIETDLTLGGEPLPEKRERGFSETSVEHVKRKIDTFQLENVQLKPGYFAGTLHTFANRRFSFVHLDCDLYSSYKTCLEFFYPRLSLGGVILLDEYNDPCWPGCNKAVDEFLAAAPAVLLEIARNNHLKYYVARRT